MDVRCASAVFFNGKVYTLARHRQMAKAIAVADGRIVGVGDDSEIKRMAPRGAYKIDLGGRAVVPGFIDCHTHFVQMGLDAMTVDLSHTKTIDEALSLMKESAKKTPHGEWVVGTNWKETGWENGRFMTRKDLDDCCPENPAVAHRVCGHLSSVNTRAIELLGIDDKTQDVERDASGRLTGILTESAVSIVRNALKPDESRKMRGLMLAIHKAHSLGVTSINDSCSQGDLAIYRCAEKAGKLSVRTYLNMPSDALDSLLELSYVSGIGSEWLKLGGLKIFCDGALGARTAALSEPFADDPGNKGMLVHSRKEFDDIIMRTHEADMQLAVHAIGDAGIEVTIKAIETALERRPRKDHRHRIEHLELPAVGHLKRMRTSKIIASMQPNFIGEWGGTDGMYLARLGPRRLVRNNPFKEILNSRVKLVFGSDCMPFSPVYGIHSAANAPHDAQRISVSAAVSAYTRDAAYASFEERLKGTIEEGKLADFVVLSADPFEDPKAISSIVVLKTVVGGSIVFERRKR